MIFLLSLARRIIYRRSENEQHCRFDKVTLRRRRLIGSPASRRQSTDVGQNDSVADRVIQYIGILSPNRSVPFPPDPSISAARSKPVHSLRLHSGPGTSEARKKGVQL